MPKGQIEPRSHLILLQMTFAQGWLRSQCWNKSRHPAINVCVCVANCIQYDQYGAASSATACQETTWENNSLIWNQSSVFGSGIWYVTMSHGLLPFSGAELSLESRVGNFVDWGNFEWTSNRVGFAVCFHLFVQRLWRLSPRHSSLLGWHLNFRFAKLPRWG